MHFSLLPKLKKCEPFWKQVWLETLICSSLIEKNQKWQFSRLHLSHYEWIFQTKSNFFVRLEHRIIYHPYLLSQVFWRLSFSNSHKPKAILTKSFIRFWKLFRLSLSSNLEYSGHLGNLKEVLSSSGAKILFSDHCTTGSVATYYR